MVGIMELNNIISRIKSINSNIKFLGQFDENNQRTGYWEEYWDNGYISSKGNYINGKKEGYWEEYYYYGNLAWKVNYLNGLEEGYWERYWPNGNLESKGNYINGIYYEI
jgi:antitoxin component YwqK of YwqJK toxin-antitoxin module